MTARIACFVGLWLAIGGAMFLAPGCYGRNCDPGLAFYGGDGGEGMLINPDTWVSSPQDGTWLWFPRQATYVFDLHALGGRTPELVNAYLSAQPQPNGPGGNWTQGGGNLVLLSNAIPNRIDAHNDTCSDYYIRLTVQAAPFPPDPDPPPEIADAGGD